MTKAELYAIVDVIFSRMTDLERQAIGPHLETIKEDMWDDDNEYETYDEVDEGFIEWAAGYWIGSPEHDLSYDS